MRKFYSPKTILLVLTLFSFVSIIKKSISSASSPPTAYTGAPGENTCISCHSGTGINAGAYYNGIQILTNMPNAHYLVNTTYQITVRLITKNCVRFGFETVALTTGNTMAGSFTITNATRTQMQSAGGKQYVMHTYNGSSALYTDSTDWTFNWTSPTSNIGNVTFYLCANVTNNDGNDTHDTIYTKSFTFPISTPPQGAIGASPVNSCVGDSVKFSGSGSNSPTGFSWTFPGGIPSTSTSQVQWVKFPNAGSPVCSLYVTNSSGTSPLVTRTVNVYTPPTSSITATGNTTFCAGDSVLLTGNTGSGNTYLWYLDGVSTGLTTNTIYAKIGGSYTLKAISPGACFAISSPIVVTVNPMPTATLSAVGNTSFCTGDSLLIKLTGTNGSIRKWYNGTTLIPGITDTFYYANSAGSYSVQLSNPNCSTTSNSINVIVNSYPSASFTSTPSGCIFILTANTGVNYKYQWFKNDTAIVNDTNITHTLNANGTYKVRVTNPSGCYLFSSSQTMNVTNLPDVTMTVSGNTTFCNGDSCTLSVPQNTAYKYQWFKNGNPLLKDTLNSILLKDSGTYLVKVSNITCTNISNTKSITILSHPDANITAANTSFCFGDSALLNAKIGSGFSYKWFRNDTLIVGQSSSSLLVKNGGNYYVNISNGYCASDGNKIALKVNSLPAVPVISRDKQTLTSTPALHYQWFKDGNVLASSQSQSLTPTVDGKYKVVVTDTNGCSNSSAEYNYALTGIQRNAELKSIRIYPSPASNYFTVDINTDQTIALQVFDAIGTEVYRNNNYHSKSAIDLAGWSTGLYVIYITNKESNSVARLIVKR